ncbi:6091_t:CDS:2 [Acaulospora morrowiae]|uniref:6091_t:CDS:1 n=1 Tax=Acaulospora morrowiae TaxID=94023 RepID=A0A9N9GLV4_9GLOM|nr:6091_t:CDS:2 [Acaulospora morrowiae]
MSLICGTGCLEYMVNKEYPDGEEGTFLTKRFYRRVLTLPTNQNSDFLLRLIVPSAPSNHSSINVVQKGKVTPD